MHAPPDSLPAGVPWECEVHVPRPADWTSIDLLYRRAGAATFTLVPLRVERGAFRGTVPGEAILPPTLEYSFSGRLASGDVVTLPEERPEEAPYRVRVAAASTGILLLAPLDGETTDTPTPEIGVLFDPPLPEPGASALFVDGEDRSADCERSVDFLLLVPRTPLAAGPHEATVVAFPESGEPRALTWSFSVLGPGAEGAPRARPAAPPPVPRWGALSGRWEAGWATATAAEAGDPLLLPYDETSSLAFNASLQGAARGGRTTFRADATREPIYDDEVRATARLEHRALRLEAGDLYPYLSELTVAWQSGKGGLCAIEADRVTLSAFGLRTIGAEVVEGFGTYAQYLWGGSATVRLGANRIAAEVAYGYDRKGSIPDSTRVTDPQENVVAGVLAGRRVARCLDLAVEVARSTTREEPADGALVFEEDGEEPDETAAALRAVATIGDPAGNRVLLEYHDYGTGYLALGSPTIDSGERGAVVDATGRLPAALRANARAEIYTDRDLFTPLEKGAPIAQVTARLDREVRGSAGTLSAYALGRYYRVPYEEIPYRNTYGTLGIYVQRGRGSLTTSVTRSRSESAAYAPLDTTAAGNVSDPSASGAAADTTIAAASTREDEWTVSVTAAASGILGRLGARAGLRWTGSDPEAGGDEDRWTATLQASLAVAGRTLSAEYQRIENRHKGSPDEEYLEHLLTVSLGGTF